MEGGAVTDMTYAEYRDSGIEWLGEIPAHWAVYQLRRRLFREAGSIKIGPFGSALKLEFMAKKGFKVYGQEHVISGDFSHGSKYVNEAKFTELAACEIRARDLVVTMMGSSGRCAVVPDGIEIGIMDSHLLRIRLPDAELVPSFVALLIDQADYVRDQIQAAGKGAIMHGLNSSIIKAIVMAVPPTAEQLQILDFLDRETAKIDALVATKERLIELLQEKRTALITRAVTRGLDPNVPMKDSGVEWLGEVPAHWEVKRVDRTAEILRGKFTHRPRNDPSLYDGPYPFIQTGDVARAQKVITGYRQTLNEQGFAVSKMFPSGTLVMTIAANIGDVAVLDFAACFPDSIVGLIPRDGVHRDYLYYVFLAMKPELLREAPVNTQGNLNVERIGSPRTQVPLPNIAEQIAIIDFLDRETITIDALIAKIRQAINHVREFRTALISAAVTGKIDVREAMPG